MFPGGLKTFICLYNIMKMIITIIIICRDYSRTHKFNIYHPNLVFFLRNEKHTSG